GLGLVPIVPAFRFYMRVHKTVYEYGLGMFAPGPSQIKAVRSRSCCEPAADKDQAMGSFRGGGGRGDVAFALGVYLAILEYRRGPAEDEIHRALYIAVFIILPGIVAMDIQGILVAQKAAVFKDRPI